MITIVLNEGFKFTMYDDAEQLPAELYKDFQKLALRDAGIGSTMEDVGSRFDAFFKFLGAAKYNEARNEAENLYYTHYSLIETINYQHLSFAMLIRSINGDVVKSHDEDGLREMLRLLSDNGLTQTILSEKLEECKKKIQSQLRTHFPKLFPDTEDIDFFSNIKNKIKLLGRSIKGERVDDELRVNGAFFISQLTSNIFNADNPKNAIVAFENNFNTLCAALETAGHNVKGLSVMEFYAKLKFFKDSNKPTK